MPGHAAIRVVRIGERERIEDRQRAESLRRRHGRGLLVLTGVLLGVGLLVMVGEQAQEMQLAQWLPTTPVRALQGVIPPWLGLWFAVFPTVETLLAQALAAVLVLGSYAVVRLRMWRAERAA